MRAGRGQKLDSRALLLLLRRTHQNLVDRHVSRSRHDVADDIGNVGRVHSLRAGETLRHLVPDLRSIVGYQLGRHSARLDQGNAYVTSGDLLPQRLAERTDSVLGGVVDATA